MKQFDRWIKSELNEYEASRPDAAWEQFANRMDHAEELQAEEHAFDQAIKQKLEPFQVSNSSSQWHVLREKLEKQALVRSEMLRIKVLEAALFALIFITLWQLQPGSSPDQQSTLPIASLHDDVLATDKSATGDLDVTNTDNPLPPSHQDQLVQEPLSATASTFPVTQTSLSENMALLMPLLPNTNNFSPQSFQTLAQDQLNPGESSSTLGLVRPIALLPTSPFAMLTVDPQSLQSMTIEQESSVRHRVSMAIHGDLNYVMTPYDQLLINRGYDQLVSGYGGWIGYAWEGPKWALRTTIAYHRKYYLPKPYTEVFDGDFERGYFSETLRDIELNLMSLSIQAQRTISRRNRWHTYGLMGGTGHLAFQANYDRKQSYAPGTDPQGGEIPEPLVPSKTSQKKYADGFFEGGSFAENSYFTLDLGIGIERYLNDRTSLFLEPVYQHNPFQKSLGPNRDRINTLSISTGVRVNL